MNLEISLLNLFVCNKLIYFKLLNKFFSLNCILQESMYFLLYNFVELLQNNVCVDSFQFYMCLIFVLIRVYKIF